MPSKEIDIFSVSEASSSRKELLGDCRLLFEAAAPEIYRNNAFRITGLNVDAKPRDISKKASDLKMMAELGDVAGTDTSCFSLKPTEDQIKSAIDRLKDPQKRIIDEFFWFWPVEFGKSSEDAALYLVKEGKHEGAYEIWMDVREKKESQSAYLSAKHNIAVMFHLLALDWEMNYHLKKNLREKDIGTLKSYWKESFKIWESLVPEDEFWSIIKKRVGEIDDPRLTTGFIRSFRNSLPEAFDKINGELAVKLAKLGKQDAAKWHVDFMRETNQGLDNIDKTAELVLSPAREEIKHLISAASRSSKMNPANADSMAVELLDKAKPILQLFDMFFSEGGYSKDDVFDEVAKTYLDLLILYANKVEDHNRSNELLRAVLPFAKSIDLRERIESNINIGKNNEIFKSIEPIHKGLKSIQESTNNSKHKYDSIVLTIIPDLEKLTRLHGEIELIVDLKNSIAIILRGISVDAYNNYKDYKTALMATELAISIAVDIKLLKSLKEEIGIIKKAEEQSKCFFCKLKDGQEKPSVILKMWKWKYDDINKDDITSFVNNLHKFTYPTKYQKIDIKVPRCENCKSKHILNVMIPGAVLAIIGAVVGIFVIPWAIVFAALILIWIFIVYAFRKSHDPRVGQFLGIFALIGSLGCFAIGGTDFAKMTQSNSIGGAFIGWVLAYAVVRLIQSPIKMAKEHPNAKKMISDGWSFGNKPT